MLENKIKNLSFFLIYAIFLVYAQPNGVDWLAYSEINIDFERFYFFREIVSWWIIGLFSELVYGNLYISILISFLLFVSTIKMVKLLSGISNNNSLLFAFLLMFSNFYLLLSVNGLRQGIALAFFMFSFSFLINKKYFYFLIFFIVSVLSHNSILILSVVIYCFLYPGLILTNLLLIALVFSGSIINRIAMKNSLDSVTNNSSLFYAVIFLIASTVLLIHFLAKKDYKNSVFYSMAAIFCIASAFVSINSAFERLVYYLIPLMVIFFSPCVNMIKNKKSVSLVLLFLMIFVSLYSLTHPSVTNNFVNL